MLADQKLYHPVKTDNCLPNYWVYGLLADDKRKAILDFRKRGLYASGVHINNNIYSVFGDKTELSGVNDFMRHFVAIPSGWWVDKENIKEIKW